MGRKIPRPTRARALPERTCIGCGQVRSAADLVRLVRTVEGTVTVGRRLAGRGAWIGPHRSCLEQAKQRSAFSRAFRATVEPAALDDVLGRWSGPDEPPTWCPLA
ncbi:MAG: YlxR family protein [Acidimicrobiia bacterium]|nr:YlxR family protein [Acidimicrobiia bacterium]